MIDKEKEKFFDEGTASYVCACQAIQEFEKIIQQKAKEILENTLNRLCSSGETVIDGKNVTLYKNQDVNLEWVSLGARCEIPPYGAYYVAANLYEKGEVEAEVLFETHTVANANLIINYIRNHPESAKKTFTNENYKYDVELIKKIDIVSLENLYDAWQGLLNDWIVFWASAKGFKAVFGS